MTKEDKEDWEGEDDNKAVLLMASSGKFYLVNLHHGTIEAIKSGGAAGDPIPEFYNTVKKSLSDYQNLPLFTKLIAAIEYDSSGAASGATATARVAGNDLSSFLDSLPDNSD